MKSRNCIICKRNKFVLAFPFNTNFNKKLFYYNKCTNCKFVRIEPNPNKEDFVKLYDNNLYHKKFYTNIETKQYKDSAKFIENFLRNNVKFLDFGCGNGHFIEQINHKYKCYGVEYDLNTIVECKKKIKNAVFLNNNQISIKKYNNFFDVIHIGDVLEHVVDPDLFLISLHKKIKKRGYLYIDGPLERNISLVNYSIILFGNIKRLFVPTNRNDFKPYHLYFCNFKNQLSMIDKLKKFRVVKYQVYETGWPYNNAGYIKKFIALISIIVSKLNILVLELEID